MINKVTLIGRLGGDPEVKHLDGGTAVAKFGLATTDSYKDKNGDWQQVTEWHNVVLWRELAERAEKSLKKGDQIYMEGKITYRKYTDKEGVERTATDIVANFVRNLTPKEKDGSQSPPAHTETKTPGVPHQPLTPANVSMGDDLPF